MDASSLPLMTKWQFYAEFAVQFVLGCAYCYAMIKLGGRNPRLGRESKPWAENFRYKLGGAFMILAGIFSYFTLPTVYHAFVDDVSSSAAEVATEAITGTLEHSSVTITATDGLIWGQASETQHEAFILMAGFFIALGWCMYVWGFKASAVGWGKKLLKIVGYAVLSCIPLFQPMKLHYFTWNEVSTEVVCLIIAGVCIALSHDWSKLPPPLPQQAGSNHQE